MNQINTTEEQLRSEIALLKRQLEQQKEQSAHPDPVGKAPTFRTLLVVAVLLGILLLAGYFRGYLPRQKREQVLAAEAQSSSESLPVVNVVKVTRSANTASLVLP